MPVPDFKTRPNDWVITTSLLNMIWRDLFGRMIPVMWAGGPVPLTVDAYLAKLLTFSPREEPNFPAYLSLSRGFLLLYIDLLHSDGTVSSPEVMKRRLEALHGRFLKEAGHPKLPGGGTYFSLECDMHEKFYPHKGTSRFDGRLAVLKNYLTDGVEIEADGDSFNMEAVPVRFFRANDVFDFIIGNTGLDLFHPASPFDAGVQGGDEKDRMANVFRAFTYRETGQRPVTLPMAGKWESGFPRERSSVHLSIPGGPSNIELEDGAALMWWIDKGFDVDAQPVIGEWLEDVENPDVDVDAFVTWLRPDRQWQIKGSIYREIMAQLPRVIATIWTESVTGATSGLDEAYVDNSDTGARQVFERRGEIGLPRESKMVFRGLDKRVGWAWADLDVKECNSDGFLSEKGILLPAHGDPPEEDALLTAWINGTAGNPVFTDCIPPGDAD